MVCTASVSVRWRECANIMCLLVCSLSKFPGCPRASNVRDRTVELFRDLDVERALALGSM